MTTFDALPGQLEIQDAVSEGDHHLRISGELDMASAAELVGVIEQLRADGTTAITLDLTNVVFMDSTGLRAVLSGQRLCEESGYEFRLIPGPPAVQRLFEVTGLIDTLPFHQPGH